jgi:hypothetical protein
MFRNKFFYLFLVFVTILSTFWYFQATPARAAVNNILLEYGDYGSFSDPSAPGNPYGDPLASNPGLYQGIRRNCVAVNFSGNTASVSVGFGYAQSSPGTTIPSSHNNVAYVPYTVPFRIEIYDGSSLVGSYDGSTALSLHAEDGHISTAPVTVNPLIQALPIAQVWSGTISNAAIGNIANPRVRYIATANTPWPNFTEYRGGWRGWTQVGGTLWYANGGDWWQQSVPYQTELDSQRGNISKQNPAWPDNSLVTSQSNQTVTYSSSPFPGCGNPAPTFSLNCSPGSASVNASAATNINLSTTAQNGFNSPVTFSTTGSLPTGVSVSYSPSNTHTPSGTTTATIQTTNSTPAGSYNITFQGTGGSVTQTCTVTLSVVSNNADFQLHISPANPPGRSVLVGDPAIYTVTAVCTGGYAGPIINLTPSTTMGSVSLSLSATTVACGAQVTLTVSGTDNASPKSAPGFDQPTTVTVTGTGT